MLVCDTFKKISQLFTLDFAQRRQERFLVLSGDAPDLAQYRPPSVCQMESVSAPVVLTLTPLHETARLEFIQQPDQAARVDIELRRQFLLA